MSRILVLSPHPDDEAIGCGGALCAHAARGDRVHVVFLSSGEKGGHGIDPVETARLREEEARRAGTILGIDSMDFWRRPDGGLRATAALADRLARALRESRPEIVYAPHPGEMHPDHKATFRLLRRVLAESSRNPREVWLYEVWTPTQRIDRVDDVSSHMERKLEAIRAYETQCRVLRFDEAARGLARYRGEMHSWPGGPYAEVFEAYSPDRESRRRRRWRSD